MQAEEQIATQNLGEAVYVVWSVKPLSHAFEKNLKTDMLILKAFWLTDVFFEQDSKKNPDHVGSQDLFKLQLEYESYPAEHINHINHMCLSHIFWIMIWILKWPQTGEIIWFYKWGKLSRDKTSLKILLITQLVILNGWHYILYISIYYSQPSSNF